MKEYFVTVNIICMFVLYFFIYRQFTRCIEANYSDATCIAVYHVVPRNICNMRERC